jgi:hypothetical protein
MLLADHETVLHEGGKHISSHLFGPEIKQVHTSMLKGILLMGLDFK